MKKFFSSAWEFTKGAIGLIILFFIGWGIAALLKAMGFWQAVPIAVIVMFLFGMAREIKYLKKNRDYDRMVFNQELDKIARHIDYERYSDTA